MRQKMFENGNGYGSRKYERLQPDFGENQRQSRSTEWKIGVVGLVSCIFVLTAKIYHAYGDDLRGLVLERKLLTYETFSEEGERMFTHGWKTAVRFSSLWLPVLCGFLTAYFTGLIVYLDSSVPGVQPPSPFSPSKYKSRSGHVFHSNYVIAVVMGTMVATYMYWKGVSLEF